VKSYKWAVLLDIGLGKAGNREVDCKFGACMQLTCKASELIASLSHDLLQLDYSGH
jgi:hypothetical protein